MEDNDMKIVDESEIAKVHTGKRTLNTPERWLLEKEGKRTRLITLSKLELGKAAIVELSDFGTNKKTVRNFDWKLNQLFILAEVPLLARKSGDDIVIRKLPAFDLEEYNKADKKELSAAHVELLKSKLAEVIDSPPSWGPED
jgi:hypothetical protein